MDPIADLLVRIKNGVMARHEVVSVPASHIKVGIVKILKSEGFIKDYDVVKNKPSEIINIKLAYADKKKPIITDIKRVSKPGLRVYSGSGEIPYIRGKYGLVIISTSQGLMTGKQARTKGIGGEILCYVW
ncbi:MAG: 30S ribosomal protein S8 [Chloroflexi bacterium]|nr:30S ribosomal protein S8 [Chloroflexota bacterium]